MGCDFSFIIPVYNAEPSQIKKCINSIEQQNLSSYEIIVVDDGSTKQALQQALQQLREENENIVVVYQSNQGSAVARNTALDMAKGDYVFFVDADDHLVPSLFSGISDEDLQADILCLDYKTKEQENETLFSLKNRINFADKKELLFANVMYCPGVLDNLMFGALWAKCFSRAYLEKYNIRFQPKLRKTQDRVFMLDAYYYAEKIVYKPIPAYTYVLNSDSITHKMNMNMLEYCYSVVSEVKESCKKKNISINSSRFFVYSVVIEMLRLTYLNKAYREKNAVYKRQMREVYKRFDLDKELEQLKASDFVSIKGKIKFFLFKFHMYGLLRLYFTRV